MVTGDKDVLRRLDDWARGEAMPAMRVARANVKDERVRHMLTVALDDYPGIAAREEDK